MRSLIWGGANKAIQPTSEGATQQWVLASDLNSNYIHFDNILNGHGDWSSVGAKIAVRSFINEVLPGNAMGGCREVARLTARDKCPPVPL